MRFLPLFVALMAVVPPLRADTMQQWVDAAPKADVVFTPWQTPSNTCTEGLRLGQGIYGYADLSKLPAAEFPVRVRLLYSPAEFYSSRKDVAFDDDNRYAMPLPGAPATPARYIDEAVIGSPAEANAVPVWNSPMILRRSAAFRYDSEMESVRLEVIGRGGDLLARRLIGASTWNQMLQRAVVVNSPGIAQIFSESGIDAVNVPGLVPDDFATINVETIWIDSTALRDASLTDAYWRRVLLDGVTVAGYPSDIATLAARLALSPGERVLNGRFDACATPVDVRVDFKWKPPSYSSTGRNIASDEDPFYFQGSVGKAMNLELIGFSRWYLGLFLVLQGVLIFVAFTQVRGQRRVWLWLVVPLFAVVYAIGGTMLSRFFVHHPAVATIDQVERQREGWPEAQVITAFSHVNLNDTATSIRFPADSRPTYLVGAPKLPDPGADVLFRHDASGAELVTSPLPARREQMFVRSWIPARPPITVTPDGRITPQRSFSGAWLWNGTGWLKFGRLQAGQPVALAAGVPILDPSPSYLGSNRMWQDDDDFPGFLKPLLFPATTSALATLGESIFFGVQPAGDCTLGDASAYQVNSRRVVAYQFHLSKAQP